MDTIVWNTGPGSLKLYVFTLKNIYHGLWPGHRLGVTKSKDCGMFVRFRRAGLSWALPADMSEQELDACLYGQFPTVPAVRPESTVISEAPVVKKTSPTAQLTL